MQNDSGKILWWFMTFWLLFANSGCRNKQKAQSSLFHPLIVSPSSAFIFFVFSYSTFPNLSLRRWNGTESNLGSRFSSGGEIYLYNKIIWANQFTHGKIFKRIWGCNIFFAIGHILYTPTLPNISVTPISQDHYHSINAIYQDNSHTHEHHCRASLSSAGSHF